MKMFKRIIVVIILIVTLSVVVVFGSFLTARRTMMQLREPGEICVRSELVLWKSDCHCGHPSHKNYRQPYWLFKMVSAKDSTEHYISLLGDYAATHGHGAPPTLSLRDVEAWAPARGTTGGLLPEKQYLNLAKAYLEKHPINGVELNQYYFDKDNSTLIPPGLEPFARSPQGSNLTQRERDLVSVEVWQKEEYWQVLTNEYSSTELSVLMTKSGQVLDAAKYNWLRSSYISKGKNK